METEGGRQGDAQAGETAGAGGGHQAGEVGGLGAGVAQGGVDQGEQLGGGVLLGDGAGDSGVPLRPTATLTRGEPASSDRIRPWPAAAFLAMPQV